MDNYRFPSQKRLSKRTFRFLTAGQETTHMDKNISREDGKMDN